MCKNCFYIFVVMALAGQAVAAAEPALVPWPKTVEVAQGVLELSPHSRIVTESPLLLPLAKVLADEIHAIAGLDLPTASGRPGPGDIVLAILDVKNKILWLAVVSLPIGTGIEKGTYSVEQLAGCQKRKVLLTRCWTSLQSWVVAWCTKSCTVADPRVRAFPNEHHNKKHARSRCRHAAGFTDCAAPRSNPRRPSGQRISSPSNSSTQPSN